MSNPVLWSGVTVAMQSALGAAQDITSITAASPPVLTYVGADPTEDSYVLLAGINSMREVNERVFRANNVSAGGNTLELEGENGLAYTAQGAVTGVGSTTGAGSLTSGLAPITFGTSLQIVTGVNASGGEPEEVDATTIHDVTRNILYGVFTQVQFSMDLHWDPSDAGLIAMKTASQTKAKRAFLISWPNGYRYAFYGRVAALGAPAGSAQGLTTTVARVSQIGVGTTYAT